MPLTCVAIVQARDFPDEEEWLEADRVRPQSQPFEDLPKVCWLLVCMIPKLVARRADKASACTSPATHAARQEGSVVLALHRSQRSDLFFEGVVTDSGPSSFCKVKFTEGRAKGSTVKVLCFSVIVSS